MAIPPQRRKKKINRKLRRESRVGDIFSKWKKIKKRRGGQCCSNVVDESKTGERHT